ncbi:uncharacterized protein LOC130630373 [Hydractinia symbiolongicarpus]|uniref:uncharacterized protein LOC130630373 n=1 Tax=Hydractinia symbiolongicarpus TaxID=13093 RepID=UPI00254F9BB6|nr:uncharacterized protein LOC130630373 [Hydractinia symbiolongicarpus]
MNDEIKQYTKWINGVFRRAWKPHHMNDLLEEISSGLMLVHLTNALYFYDLPILYKAPSTHFEKEQNVQLCLEVLKTEGVRLSGVRARDVADKNVEVILSLCSFLKRHFSTWQLLKVHSSNNNKNPVSVFELINKSVQAKCTVLQSHHSTRSSSAGTLRCDDQEITVARPASLQTYYPVKNYNTTRISISPEESLLTNTLYVKEDMGLLEWVSCLTGFTVVDYSSFADGIILLELVNRILPVQISRKIFYAVSYRERVQLILDAIYHDLKIDTCLTPLDIIEKRNFKHFVSLLRSLKILHEENVTLKKLNASKQVTWDPNTFGKNTSREKYLGCKKHEISWVEDMKQYVPSLSYREQDFSLSDQTSGSRKDKVDKSVIKDLRVRLENIRELDNSKDGVHQPVQKNVSEGEKSEKSLNKPIKKQERLDTTPLMEGSKSTYTPPRWSQILKEELQFLAEDNENRYVASVSGEETLVNNTSSVRGLAAIDQEIAAVFENYSGSEEESVYCRYTSSTPFFVPRMSSDCSTQGRRTASPANKATPLSSTINLNDRNVLDFNAKAVPQITISESKTENKSKTGVQKVPLKQSKWHAVTDMVRAQSRSPSGLVR